MAPKRKHVRYIYKDRANEGVTLIEVKKKKEEKGNSDIIGVYLKDGEGCNGNFTFCFSVSPTNCSRKKRFLALEYTSEYSHVECKMDPLSGGMIHVDDHEQPTGTNRMW